MSLRTVTIALRLVAVSLVALSPGLRAQSTVRVSVDSAGAEASHGSSDPSISADGRFIAFSSGASNLVADDTNDNGDVFVHDRETGITTRVSVNSRGREGRGWSWYPSLSPSGRFVAFHSHSKLDRPDLNDSLDVFVHDRVSGVTRRVSVDSAGVEGNGSSAAGSLSFDGEFVAFQSMATNLVAGDTNGEDDVFLHDLRSGVTTLVSVDSSGQQGNGRSRDASISWDGRFVAFLSEATNLVAGDHNNQSDVFVRDTVLGKTARVSVDSMGREVSGSRSYGPAISGNGRFVAFGHESSTLVPFDSNGVRDVFVHDRETGVTTRESLSSWGTEGGRISYSAAISADGRIVAFATESRSLVSGDNNQGSDIVYRDRWTGITRLASKNDSGVVGDSSSNGACLSGDGRFVGFYSHARNLVPGDLNNEEDIFVHGVLPFLSLDVQPQSVSAGDAITLTTTFGRPGSPALLSIVALNGTPRFIQVAPHRFGATGVWRLAATVPPGLAGNVLTFQTLGFLPAEGKPSYTEMREVTFQ